jgi:GNAT superfamily N-acetyltransferase
VAAPISPSVNRRSFLPSNADSFKLEGKSHQAVAPRFQGLVSERQDSVTITRGAPPVSAQDMYDLLHTSGHKDNIQNAHLEPKRLAFLTEPKPFYVAARDTSQADKLVGLAVGVHLGDYVLLSRMMVDRAYQNRGIGSGLIDAFRKEGSQMVNDGPVSLVALTADPMNQDHPSHHFIRRRGFINLPNAVYLPRHSPFFGPNTHAPSTGEPDIHQFP